MDFSFFHVEPELARPVNRRGKRIVVGRMLLPRSDDERIAATLGVELMCTSRAGRPRLDHEPDKDGKCVWCSLVVA